MSDKEPHAKLGRSGEDYLEAILRLSYEFPVVRSINIAEKLGRSKASVSVAMKKLLEDGYIQKSQEGSITLTEKGRVIAEEMDTRHRFFAENLIEIGIDPQAAEVEACRMEHVISQETFQKLVKANAECKGGNASS